MILILFGLLLATLYFEFKYMRPKRRDQIEAVLTRDDAYNALMSAKAVSKSLKDMGKDTREAEVLIERAQLTYDQRDYLKTISIAKTSKELLVNAKDAPLPEPVKPRKVEPQEREEVKEEKTVHEVKKLPQNYLESKFLMSTAQADVEKAEKEGKDVEEAKKLLCEAQECFDSKDYTACLKTCMRAKRTLAGAPAERPTSGGTVVADVSGTGQIRPSEKDADVPAPDACGACGQELVEGDSFCGKCGAKVEREEKCSSCGNVLRDDDAFCRKCGTKRV